MHGRKMRDSGNKLKEKRFRCVRKNFLTLRTTKKWNRLTRVIVPFASLEVFSILLDKSLSEI